MRGSFPTTPVALTMIAAVGCTLAPEEIPTAEDFYTKDEIETRLGFLADCAPGDVLVRDASGWACTANPACPPGFAASMDGTVAVCSRQFATVTDQMVKAGSFWIDRYEASLCPGGAEGSPSGNDTTGAACSRTGEPPLVTTSWFQAAQMCANAGKHLCTNAEWQQAVAGTIDPTAWPGTSCTAAPQAGLCNTCSNALRAAGQGTQCRSRAGAEDMIGNAWEWVAEWQTTGMRWFTAQGQAAFPWPTGLGFGDDGDASWNIDGTAHNGSGWVSGAPSALARGGSRTDGGAAGAYAVSFSLSPSYRAANVGARCCLTLKRN